MADKITDAGAQLSGGLWVTGGGSTVTEYVLIEALDLAIVDDELELELVDCEEEH